MLRSKLLNSLLLVILLAGFCAANDETSIDRTGIDQAFGNLPLYFIENQGQIDSEEVAFYVKGSDKTIYFTPEGIIFSLQSDNQRWTARLEFVGAAAVKPVGVDKQEAVFSYFKGKPEDWKTGLPTYGEIVYENLWPGIDLVYSGSVNQLKYEFVVEPGADPEKIRLAYRGVSGLEVTDEGVLQVTTPACGFEDGVPLAWQDIEGERRAVSMSYVLGVEEGEGVFPYGFTIGDYDSEKPLVLDPAILVYCGYIGGSDDDWSRGIAVDGQGNAYVTGKTYSHESTFPVKIGPDLSFNGGLRDAFVARVNAQGTSLDYCGYIGGNDYDSGQGIALDGQGNAYVTGTTVSDESTFPVTAGPDLTFNGGSQDAFVARINAQGTGLDYCGYIGGSDLDSGVGIALDGQGIAYVTGCTASDESTFPVTIGPDLSFNGGTRDAFVARINAQGTSLDYCGYIGGYIQDIGEGIAVDGLGNAYVSGTTSSSEAEGFPVLVGPDLSYNGGQEAYVARVNAQGTGLDYCGYIGGPDYDCGLGIAVDGQGNAYVTGVAESDETSFPVTVGPDLSHNGRYDAFVARVNAQGTSLDYCGYIGGSLDDWGRGIALDGQGNAYVTGTTVSHESTFPVKVGPDLTFNGGLQDAFVARVNAQGTSLDYCGYIGGSGQDKGRDIAVDGQGNAYVTGETESNQSSFPLIVGPDLTFNGGSDDSFVAKVAFWEFVADPDPDIKANGSDGPLVISQGTNVQVEITMDPADSAGVNADWWLLADSPLGWHRFRLFPRGWTSGFVVTYQGTLFEFGPMYVLNSSGLPVGTYVFYFGVDLDMNGVLDPAEAFYDSVQVTVQ